MATICHEPISYDDCKSKRPKCKLISHVFEFMHLLFSASLLNSNIYNLNLEVKIKFEFQRNYVCTICMCMCVCVCVFEFVCLYVCVSAFVYAKGDYSILEKNQSSTFPHENIGGKGKQTMK